MKSIDWKSLGILAAMFAFALFFWDWTFMFFVKAPVVLWHEFGHAVGAWATGGGVDRIEMGLNLGGACWSAGGWRWVVLPAGYLGSLVFGAAILIGASKSRHDKLIALAIGAGIIIITVLLVRNLFGVLFCTGFGVFLILSGYFLPAGINDILLKFLGLTSCMYAVIDIKEDLISRTVPGSDAYAMSQEFFGPPAMWGVLWMIIALAGSAFFLYIAVRKRK